MVCLGIIKSETITRASLPGHSRSSIVSRAYLLRDKLLRESLLGKQGNGTGVLGDTEFDHHLEIVYSGIVCSRNGLLGRSSAYRVSVPVW